MNPSSFAQEHGSDELAARSVSRSAKISRESKLDQISTADSGFLIMKSTTFDTHDLQRSRRLSSTALLDGFAFGTFWAKAQRSPGAAPAAMKLPVHMSDMVQDPKNGYSKTKDCKPDQRAQNSYGTQRMYTRYVPCECATQEKCHLGSTLCLKS